MAMLLAVFQKMRLIREKNQLVLEQSQFSSKISRIEKNIANTQKRYTSMLANIDKQAQMMQSQASIFFQNMMGLGANCVNPYNYSGMNGFIAARMQEIFANGGIPQYDKDGNITDYLTIKNSNFETMMTEYSNTGSFKTSEDGKGYANFDENDVKAFLAARNYASQMQQQAQFNCQQMQQQYTTNISIWTEAAKAQIEAEQDAMLEPLNYEQTMLELDKELKEQRLARINAEIESYETLCKEETQNSAPKFGLG
ncbi:hypothetical protein IKB17_06960 [bacterium]|nr:hypothetical protein [bacterium]